MIAIETRQLAGGVVLHAFPEGKRAVPLPCVVFYHGFTSSSLVYSYFAVALAQAGLRVVMPDAPEHGARFGGDSQGRIHRFWQILHQNMQEFTTLRAAIQAENWLLDGRLAVGGASMGGMTALGIMTRHREVKCGASLMGSGYFTGLARTLFPPLREWEVTHQLERLADRPLLLWHGQEDDVVPAIETFRLQQALAAAKLDKHVTCLWAAGVRHRITPEALSATVAFFRQYL
ncbi:esterase [Salmonella enterica subsp. enterica]|nr:esterase [Salmonella enterica subsp. enterica serovar Chester]EBI9498199.1 esterase [Salmonella enterica]ECD5095750.1 esterase [Salmonella enterica subsp. enterica serovar Sandiego]EBX2680971.1 esterase [Salmonella enterica subsp. enterica serovar Chester]ECD2456965.1 esterase [Salmonella enterica subsp. enterica serovar Chester]